MHTKTNVNYETTIQCFRDHTHTVSTTIFGAGRFFIGWQKARRRDRDADLGGQNNTGKSELCPLPNTNRRRDSTVLLVILLVGPNHTDLQYHHLFAYGYVLYDLNFYGYTSSELMGMMS